MKFIKKAISSCLAAAVTFGGVYAKPPMDPKSEEISARSHSEFSGIIPVLIVGGTEESRNALIEDLKNGVTIDTGEHRDIVEIIEQIFRKSGNNPLGTGDKKYSFKNWRIRHCNFNDVNLPKLEEEARLIIVFQDGYEAHEEVEAFISNSNKPDCIIEIALL